MPRLDEVQAIWHGSIPVQRVMLGAEEIWSATPPFDPLTAIGWAHAGWADDPLWARPADGQPVVSWRNASGGGDPTQATAGNRPTMDYDGLGGKGAVVFDGNDGLISASTLPRPFSLIAVAADAGAGSGLRFSIGRGSAGSGMGVDGATGEWMVFTQSAARRGGSADSAPHLQAAAILSGSAFVEIDGAEVAAYAGSTQALTGFGVGSRTTLDQPWSGPIAFWAIYTGDVTAHPNWAAFKAWVTSYYGIPTV